jgi:hypothetical protein
MLWIVMTLLSLSGFARAAQGVSSMPSDSPSFRYHRIPANLPLYRGDIGDYGQTAVADIDKDGRLDFIIGRKRQLDWKIEGTIYWFRNLGSGKWEQRVLGRDSLSDVGAAALDVDGDGWIDVVCGGVWYRNPKNPREKEFDRFVYDPDGEAAHDVVVADINGDGRPEIVTLSDKKGLRWYRIPDDPTGKWEMHPVGPGIHGAIAPAGIADIDGDGDLDIVRGNAWFENKRGDGTEWVEHDNIPFGRSGPYGICVRTWIGDIDGDGKAEVVMLDADIEDSKATILRNVDGKGGKWERRDLPQSFKYGSLHSLAVADFNGDGRLDIVSNEQEELLPDGRENPRFILWENLGGGKFAERIILDAKLGGHELLVGDFNGDGAPDIVSKPWGVKSWNGAGGEMHVDYLENLSGKK